MSRFHAVLVLFILVHAERSVGDEPYPPSSLIEDVELDWSTHRRDAQGSDNFQLTWADDDNLYGAWGDGGGFGGTNSRGRVGLGVARIEGNGDNWQGRNVWGGHDSAAQATFDGKSWGMISVEGELFMWVVPDRPYGKSYRNHYEFIELARSRDYGTSWQKSVWRFTEAEELTIPTFLNFGRHNSSVPNKFAGYVYTYFIQPTSPMMEQEGPQASGLIVHKPGVLYLARVHNSELFSRKSNYQFFVGTDSTGQPKWGELSQKQPVFSDPNGVGWCLSASYHPSSSGSFSARNMEQARPDS